VRLVLRPTSSSQLPWTRSRWIQAIMIKSLASRAAGGSSLQPSSTGLPSPSACGAIPPYGKHPIPSEIGPASLLLVWHQVRLLPTPYGFALKKDSHSSLDSPTHPRIVHCRYSRTHVFPPAHPRSKLIPLLPSLPLAAYSPHPSYLAIHWGEALAARDDYVSRVFPFLENPRTAT
jgi:hypothetical protein